MIVNQDHLVNRIDHDPGVHQLSIDEFETPYVLVAVRILVDPSDPDDVAAIAALQDRVAATAYTRRLHQLGLLSDWQYRSLMIELTKRGYRSGEPDDMQRESSQLMHMVLAELISVAVDLVGFDRDHEAMAVLGDYCVSTGPKVARLTYAYGPRAGAVAQASEADYEAIIFGGRT